jgi:hypothetical protein
VLRLRHYLSSITISPLGIFVLGVLVVACGLFLFGPHSVQAPAMIIGVILLVGVVGGVPLGRGGFGGRALGGRRRYFAPIDRHEMVATPADEQNEEEVWRKERERYAQAQDERSG